MIRYFENYTLTLMNTFGIDVRARYFFEFTEPSDFQEFTETKVYNSVVSKLIIGGGSNLLFTADFEGIILYPNIPGISIEREDRSFIWLRVGAGVVWDQFVEYTVREGWGGIENLSLIPGKVGATPVQNIGAYGQEVSDVIVSVEGIDLLSGRLTEIHANECGFAYRNSIFKEELKHRFIITSVLYKLDKFPQLNLNYKGIGELLSDKPEPGVADVRTAVIAIRRAKLPDPAELGNAGSFFKNPLVSVSKADELRAVYPDMPAYKTTDHQQVKLSAGWLIEKCGWKGFRRGGAGVHHNHALVLVNYGNATGSDVFSLSEDIRLSVLDRFGVDLEREVLVIGPE